MIQKGFQRWMEIGGWDEAVQTIALLRSAYLVRLTWIVFVMGGRWS